MAHYAKVVNSIVTKVIVAEAEFFDTFVDSSPGEWIETSDSIRKNFAGVGDTYDATRDAFYVANKPHASWGLNETTCQWTPPVARPIGNNMYNWNEDTTAWVEVV